MNENTSTDSQRSSVAVYLQPSPAHHRHGRSRRVSTMLGICDSDTTRQRGLKSRAPESPIEEQRAAGETVASQQELLRREVLGRLSRTR